MGNFLISLLSSLLGLLLTGIIFVSMLGTKVLGEKRKKLVKISRIILAISLIFAGIAIGIFFLYDGGHITFAVLLAFVVISGFAWLLIQKTKEGTTVVVGLFSLLAMVFGFLLNDGLVSLKNMGVSTGWATLFTWVLMLGFLAVFVLSIISIINLIGKNKETAYKFLKRTFQVSVLVISVILLIMLFTTMLKADEINCLFANVLDLNSLSVFANSFFILLLTWSLLGLFLVKKEQKNIPLEEQTTLSNRVGLSITSFMISLVSLLPTGLMLYLSFFGDSYYGGETFIGMIRNMSGVPNSLILVCMVFFVCSLMFVIVVLLSGLFTVLTGALKPEKAKKWLNIMFFATMITSIITFLCSIIPFDVAITKFSIVKMLDNMAVVFIFPLIIIFVLSIVGILLVQKSKTISVAEVNAKKAQEKEAKREASQKVVESAVKSVDAGMENVKKGVETSTEFVKQYTLIVQQFLQKIKNILVTPKTTWQTIESENSPSMKVLTSYVLPLTAIVAVMAFIGWGFIGFSQSTGYYNFRFHSASYGFKVAIAQVILMGGGIYLTALLVNLLSDNFGANKNFDKAFSLVAYSCTPVLLGGISHLIPSVSWLVLLFSFYGFYLFYIGLKPMMQVQEEKKTPYLALSIGSLIIVFFVLGWILTKIMEVSVIGNIAW